MEEFRIIWEPESKISLANLEMHAMRYSEGILFDICLMGNGTFLFVSKKLRETFNPKRAIEDSKYLSDFQTIKMKDGDYLVKFHEAVSVLVTSSEFQSMREEIIRRVNDLMFPEEVFYQDDPTQPKDNLLIGLYARGKLQYDAYHFSFYKRIEGKGKKG